MKTLFIVCTIFAYAIYVLAQHQHCHSDPECANVTCIDNTHSAYCHSHECHCHDEHECYDNSDCAHCGDYDINDCTNCGDTGYSCDNHHCHGPKCTHNRK